MPCINLKKMQFKNEDIQEAKKAWILESFYSLLIQRFYMTKVYCCNFTKQIYQWFEYRKKTCGSFSLYLISLSLKMIGWKAQELSIKHLKVSIAHYFKTGCNFFWYGLKPALLISHTSVDPLI